MSYFVRTEENIIDTNRSLIRGKSVDDWTNIAKGVWVYLYYSSFNDIKEEIENYYLYYKTSNYSFHIPIGKFEVDKLMLESVIKIINIDKLVTYGKEVGGLLSVQFVKKIVDLINNEDYQLLI